MRNLRQQVAGNPKDQSTKIQHRVPASRDSQSTASTIEFTTGTAPNSKRRYLHLSGFVLSVVIANKRTSRSRRRQLALLQLFFDQRAFHC
jgi:hypothetical protein